MSAESFITILRGVQWTVLLSLSSFALGSLLAVPLCAMRISRSSSLSFASSAIIVVIRSIPPIVWLFILFFGLGSGFIPLGAFSASVISLALITMANMAEIYRGALQSIHPGQFEAARALNMPQWSRFADVIAPQLFRVALPSAATFLIGLMKDSAIASAVGVTEIAFQANFIARREFVGLQIFAFAGVLYIMMSLPVAFIARYADSVLRSKVAQ